ncbi:hypothetical protein ACIHCV_41965 [Streptomyces sp. NPDC051956]|uniref:hypothetical protein n=1 Tax=Streptomyces sp. NPDC051956 TaxID=3365677 RepID=UPI0037D72319
MYQPPPAAGTSGTPDLGRQRAAKGSLSGRDRVRRRAWERMQEWSSDREAPVLPRHCWCYHDLRHTFALRLLIYLTREAFDDIKARQLPGLRNCP